MKRLQEEWRLYASDVEAFRTWLLDRLSLSALGGRGNALASVRQAGERLQRLRYTYRKLTQNAPSVDPILEKLDEQYQDLLYRLSRHEGHPSAGSQWLRAWHPNMHPIMLRTPRPSGPVCPDVTFIARLLSCVGQTPCALHDTLHDAP
ncbi:unnamed protein product [Mesocestoides corti]|uniref:Uncharacterized protein n=1 Tax=Mesocestoides corti TaxID=53468 RepID=A0A3P6GY93_MESCO|nr:unnamed protein product [Mesocestoides corti]